MGNYQKYQYVFSPLTFGNVTIKNRIEFPPVVPILASADGYVTPELIEFEKSLARGGPGIVTIGDSAIDFEYARDHEGQLNLGTDHVIPGLRSLVEVIHRYGAKASIEVNHGGRFVAPRLLNGKEPIAPSSVSSSAEEMFPGEEGRRKIHVKEMDQNLIDQVIENYANACFRCLQAGFEMVLLHGGHGHLLSQFVSPFTNKRKDSYGGSLENRAKFVIEVLNAIRKKVGNQLALEYRISADELIPEGMHLEDTIEFIKMIQDKIDVIHVSVGLITEADHAPITNPPTYYPHGYNVHYAETIKKEVKIPVATVGAIASLEMADEIIQQGKADIVAMARSAIADPEIVNKTRRGKVEDIRPCLRCGSCTERTAHFFPLRCAVNPVIGREIEFSHLRLAEEKKKIVIVGGGPAGMEAAQIASSRGHAVTLFEKEDKLGGTLHVASALPFKADMRKYLNWLINKTEQSAARIRLSTEATPAIIEAENPDVLILAVGAVPLIPDIPGIKSPVTIWAGDVDNGAPITGDKIVVAGAGMTGFETALALAQQGKQVTVVDMVSLEEVAKDCPVISRIALLNLLKKHGVEIKTNLKIEKITNRGVAVIDKQWQRYEIPADKVVLSLGVKPRTEVIKALEASAPEVYIIGDCAKPRNLMSAIHEAFDLAAEI